MQILKIRGLKKIENGAYLFLFNFFGSHSFREGAASNALFLRRVLTSDKKRNGLNQLSRWTQHSKKRTLGKNNTQTGLGNSYKWISSYLKPPGACIIKLITAVIYSFCNKLECLSLYTRLGWKGLPGTNTLAFYGNRKLRP